MLKSWGWVVAHEIMETAQSPNSRFGFWSWTLDWDLDSGLSISPISGQWVGQKVVVSFRSFLR